VGRIQLIVLKKKGEITGDTFSRGKRKGRYTQSLRKRGRKKKKGGVFSLSQGVQREGKEKSMMLNLMASTSKNTDSRDKKGEKKEGSSEQKREKNNP